MTVGSAAKFTLAAILVAADLFLLLFASLWLLGATGDLIGFLPSLWWLSLCVVCVDAGYVVVIVLIGKVVVEERGTLLDAGNLLTCSVQGFGVAAVGVVLAIALWMAVWIVQSATSVH